ncbi:MAG: SCO family protein, partial [Roseibium sp.]
SVFLMDANNHFVGTVAYGEAEDSALKKLQRLIENAPASS